MMGCALVQELTNGSRGPQLHLVRMENVVHASSCPMLKGTMQDNQGLLWHARVHEGMDSAQKLLQLRYRTIKCTTLVNDPG